VSYHNYKFYATNGKHLSYEVYFCGDGLCRNLQPHHRANALTLFGMYKETKKHRTPDEKSRNYQLCKEWGSNFFVGDIVIKLKFGQELPDLSKIENPIEFMIMYGDDSLPLLCMPDPSPNFKKKYPDDWQQRASGSHKREELGGGVYTMADLENRGWERHNYKLACFRKESLTQEFIDQLTDWCGDWDIGETLAMMGFPREGMPTEPFFRKEKIKKDLEDIMNE